MEEEARPCKMIVTQAFLRLLGSFWGILMLIEFLVSQSKGSI